MKEFEVMPLQKAEIVPAGSIMLQPLEFTEEQKTLIKRMCQAEGLDDNEFQVFMHICKRRRLDPILRQIYATKRNKKLKEGNVEKWVKILVPIVAIEGMTAIADRSGTYAPSEKVPLVEWAQVGEKVNLKNPLAVTIWVKKFRQGEWHEFPFTAYFTEFVQDTDLWRKMPIHMLTKCARAGALRMGWPEDCGGLYIEEEWAPDTTGEPVEPAKAKERERGSIGKLKKSNEENRGHGEEGMQESSEPKSTKVLDQYSTAIKAAFLKSNVTREWVEVKVEGGTANIWNDLSLAYREEKVPLTVLYCWHKSLFEALLLKPQKIVLSVSNKEGSKFSPVIEDILAVDEKKYEKGKPYVAPEVAEMPKPEPEWKKCPQCNRENSVKSWQKNKGKCPNCDDLHNKEAESSDRLIDGRAREIANKQTTRTTSILELTDAFEKNWPAKDKSVHYLRNKVGQMLLTLESKEQLNDLSYPQEKIDAAIKALNRYAKLTQKPSNEAGILNEIEVSFKDELAQIQAEQTDLGF